MLPPYGLLPGPEPHPDLLAATSPTARDVLMAVAVMGWLPEERWEPAAVT